MDGVHDLGGMHGFGPIRREPDEPVFHTDWERRAFGMTMGAMPGAGYNIDELRHAIERMDPAHYLSSTYYEHWLCALETALVEHGLASREEIEARVREMAAGNRQVPEKADPGLANGLRGLVRGGYSTRRDSAKKPRFARGDRVAVRNEHPAGHTRCPRYVRGASGVVERCWGSFVLPDQNAHAKGESPEPVYCVAFEAGNLWGSAAEAAEVVYVDLWESYLDPVTGKTRTRRAAK
jgi:nitrile hydratase subunit beta